MSSISIATLGMFPLGGGGGIGIIGSGVPVEFRKEEYILKPTILVKNIEYLEESKEQKLKKIIVVTSVK